MDTPEAIEWPIQPSDQMRQIGNASREYQHYPQFNISPKFHGGIDIITAPLTSKLRAVTSGVVDIDYAHDIASKYRWIRIYNSELRTMYLYLHSTVPEKTVIDAAEYELPIDEDTVLGSVVEWFCGFYHHLHFSRYQVPPGHVFEDEHGNPVEWHEWEGWSAYETDPLVVLTPYDETSPPVIESIEIVENVSHDAIDVNHVTGEVDVIVTMWDTNHVSGLYKTGNVNARLTIRNLNGGYPDIDDWGDLFEDEFVPPREAAAIVFDDSSTSDACGSLDERYDYVLTNRVPGGYDEAAGFWDTTAVDNGEYEIEVTVWDQNSTTTESTTIYVEN